MFKKLFIYFSIGCFIGLLIGLVNPYDPTDYKSEKIRSGLIWYKDYGTGCEYIAAPRFFGISKTELIPRVDRNGNHICE